MALPVYRVPVPDRILSALEQAGARGMDLRAIAERVGHKPSDIVATLSRMCDNCKIDAGTVMVDDGSGRKKRQRTYWLMGQRPYSE
jgi:hypothetical protein